MNLRQKRIHKANIKINVGGTEDVPPTFCLSPADASAYIPAHAERTSSAVSSKLQCMGDGKPVAENSLILFLEAAP
jgi:hypothetical protein